MCEMFPYECFNVLCRMQSIYTFHTNTIYFFDHFRGIWVEAALDASAEPSQRERRQYRQYYNAEDCEMSTPFEL